MMNNHKELLPWRALIRIGFGQLKLSPQQFWQLTPKELKYAIEGAIEAATGTHFENQFSYENLDHLMKQFPDNIKSKANE